MEEEVICKTEKKGDITVMTLMLDAVLVDENEGLKKAFNDVLDKGNKKIVLDLANTFYVSSLILASLVYMHKKAADAGGSLVMCGVNARVKEILEMTNLDKVFDIVSDRQVATDKLGKKS